MTGGLLAAVVGIGGGVVYSPLFLELGIPPKSASATAMFLVLYTSLANTIQFAIGKQLDYQYGMWLALWVVAGTLTGLTVVGKVVKKSGRQSIIVFLLMTVLLIAAGATLVLDTINIVGELDHGESIWSMGSVC